MKYPIIPCRRVKFRRHWGERGTASVELAILLPLLLVILFAIIDMGRLLDTRQVVIKLAQQGAELGYRTLDYPTTTEKLLEVLQKSGNLALDVTAGSAKDFATSGKIFFWKINGGTPPAIVTALTGSAGSLTVTGSYTTTAPFGVSQTLYNRLASQKIAAVVVVEVFYQYRPITPLSNLILGLLTKDSGGINVSSRAVFAANAS